jgi:hypothetical protein
MSSTAVELDGRPLASQRVPQDLYRLLVLRNSGSEILVASDRPPFTLPCVEILRWERVAENLSQAVRKRYGIFCNLPFYAQVVRRHNRLSMATLPSDGDKRRRALRSLTKCAG